MRRPAMHLAPHERDVLLLDLAVVKLPGELLVRGVVLGDDHQSRRAAIQPVHDARPLLAADAAQVVDVVEQRVDERAALRGPAAGCTTIPAGLSTTIRSRVLVEDRQRQRLGLAAPDRPARGSSTVIACPASPAGWLWLSRPATCTWPSLISR